MVWQGLLDRTIAYVKVNEDRGKDQKKLLDKWEVELAIKVSMTKYWMYLEKELGEPLEGNVRTICRNGNSKNTFK